MNSLILIINLVSIEVNISILITNVLSTVMFSVNFMKKPFILNHYKSVTKFDPLIPFPLESLNL